MEGLRSELPVIEPNAIDSGLLGLSKCRQKRVTATNQTTTDLNLPNIAENGL